MPVSFFGQFLLKRGVVDAEAIAAGMDYRDACNRRFGELAVERGLLTEVQAQAVFTAQKQDLRPFGEVALRLRFLTRKQLDSLLFSQTILCTHLGEALLRKGFLDEEQFSSLLAAYDAEQQGRRRALAALLEVTVNPAEAMALVEALRRVLFRYLAEDVKIVAADRDVTSQEYAGLVALDPACGEGGPLLELLLPRSMLDLVARACLRGGGAAWAQGEALPSCWDDFMGMLGRYMRLAVPGAGRLAWRPALGDAWRRGGAAPLVVDTMAGPWGVLLLPRRG